jgi:hypothetical protein
VSVVPEPIAFCPPGKQPAFVLGFADLRDAVGDAIGTPIECEHIHPTSGDTVQQTTSGLAVFHNGHSSFSDGWHHWETGDGGVRQWEGDEVPDKQ